MDYTSLPVIIAIAFALGADAFAVGLSVGAALPGVRAAFRLWFHFGLFQSLMTLLGWSVGGAFLFLIRDYDHWVLAGLLAIIAARMFHESLNNGGVDSHLPIHDRLRMTKGWSLVTLSLATSFDALAVGVGMGIVGSSPFLAVVWIGLIAGLMTYAGIRFGRRLSLRFGKRAETAGAVLLFAIAFKLLSV